MTFSDQSYRRALYDGALEPSRALTPLINVSRDRYGHMQKSSNGLRL